MNLVLYGDAQRYHHNLFQALFPYMDSRVRRVSNGSVH